jgi:hypothetical protein
MTSVAAAYIGELKAGLDQTWVPVFPPDTQVNVGDFGSFEDGRWIRRGSVFQRGLTPVLAAPTGTAPWSWASTAGVTFGPSVKIPSPVGGELVEAMISFGGKRGVVVSYGEGAENGVADADQFAAELWQLWWYRSLPVDRAVVWRTRTAATGTVMVAVERGAKVTVSIDAAKLAAIAGAAAVGLAELRLGVNLSADRGSTYGLSRVGDGTEGLTQWVSLYCLSQKDQPRVIDAHGFQERGDSVPVEPGRPVPGTIDDVMASLPPDTD